MAELSPETARRRPSTDRLRRDSLYEGVYNNPNIVNDGFTTYDAHSSEDEAPTRPRVRARPVGQQATEGPLLTSVETTAIDDAEAPIYTKAFGSQRKSRYADLEAAISLHGTVIQPVPTVGASSKSANRNPHFFEIMHNWTQEKKDEIPQINVMEKHAAEAGQIRGHIGWMHSEVYNPSLKKLEDLFMKYLASDLRYQINETTISLLKRAKANGERKYVNGKFLVPGPVRYDGQLSQSGEDDHPCTFFSFPYFAVGDFESKAKEEANQPPEGNTSSSNAGRPIKESGIHPVRMLLQSRYRLESTRKRDQNQSISSLTSQEVTDCIRAPPDKIVKVKSSKWKQKIHVPQLWGLSISGDNMITSGPISESHLRSTVLELNPVAHPGSQLQSGPSIVRINLEYNGKNQPSLWPADQCACYFGLVNIERRVASTLGRRKDKSDFAKYKLYSKEGNSDYSELVTSENWIKILREHSDSEMDLWMERELPPIEVTTHSESRSNTSVVGQTYSSSLIPNGRTADDTSRTLTVVRTSSTQLRVSSGQREPSQSLANSSVVSRAAARQLSEYESFLRWPLEEDRKNPPGRTPGQRVDLWLEYILHRILRSHDADLWDDTQAHLSGSLEPQQQIDANSSSHLILTLSQEKVRDLLKRSLAPAPSSPVPPDDGRPATALPDLTPQTSGNAVHETQPLREVDQVFAKARHLLALFVPGIVRSSDPTEGTFNTADHRSVRIYWGLVGRIIEHILAQRLHATELTMLLKALSDLIGLAEILHRGVRKYESKVNDDPDESPKTANVESAVIQKPIPEALESIYHFLFEVAKYSTAQIPGSPLKPTAFSGTTGRHLKEAEDALNIAQDYLIAAAADDSLDKSLGPVVTPEAILLLLLERLSRGVYNNDSIDIIDLYEKIVEKLASNVTETHASRRLLLEINKVMEELDIVMDVLVQQRKFFEIYRKLLDPAGFDQPSAKRRTRYPFEKKAIDRNVRAIKDRIGDCEELQKRTSRLATQNVQLVDTYQEANNTRLLIFTLVTITFLPLSFVTGFFGMNVQGISATKYSVGDFWAIAVPVTAGVVIISVIFTYWGHINKIWSEFRQWLNRDEPY